VSGVIRVFPPFFIFLLDWGEWLAFFPCRFTSAERAAGTLWIEGWVDPRANLDSEEFGKITCLFQESNPGLVVSSPLLRRLSCAENIYIYTLSNPYQLHALTDLPLGKSPRYPLDWDWLGHGASLNTVEYKKITCPCRKSKACRIFRSPSLHCHVI
jgi:hypothetical protein